MYDKNSVKDTFFRVLSIVIFLVCFGFLFTSPSYAYCLTQPAIAFAVIIPFLSLVIFILSSILVLILVTRREKQLSQLSSHLRYRISGSFFLSFIIACVFYGSGSFGNAIIAFTDSTRYINELPLFLLVFFVSLISYISLMGILISLAIPSTFPFYRQWKTSMRLSALFAPIIIGGLLLLLYVILQTSYAYAQEGAIEPTIIIMSPSDNCSFVSADMWVRELLKGVFSIVLVVGISITLSKKFFTNRFSYLQPIKINP